MTVDVRQLVESLVGKPITTVTGYENRILSVRGGDLVVATARSPRGQPVPLVWVADALHRLLEDREIEISVESVGYRSAFVGAVLKQVPGAEVMPTSPPRIRLPRTDW